ncbi:MAG: hypothetical protein S4CHLAM45_01210 [Chlamydiales bacterium]|nr:hypothetical protein [Chlamydiales bacterium]MCH9619441.1 hypothetical protein [Chlamydiales bacterium]MCH9622245.1 hypothetical protein [Chlamydiales bacterium]
MSRQSLDLDKSLFFYSLVVYVISQMTPIVTSTYDPSTGGKIYREIQRQRSSGEPPVCSWARTFFGKTISCAGEYQNLQQANEQTREWRRMYDDPENHRWIKQDIGYVLRKECFPRQEKCEQAYTHCMLAHLNCFPEQRSKA